MTIGNLGLLSRQRTKEEASSYPKREHMIGVDALLLDLKIHTDWSLWCQSYFVHVHKKNCTTGTSELQKWKEKEWTPHPGIPFFCCLLQSFPLWNLHSTTTLSAQEGLGIFLAMFGRHFVIQWQNFFTKSSGESNITMQQQQKVSRFHWGGVLFECPCWQTLLNRNIKCTMSRKMFSSPMPIQEVLEFFWIFFTLVLTLDLHYSETLTWVHEMLGEQTTWEIKLEEYLFRCEILQNTNLIFRHKS